MKKLALLTVSLLSSLCALQSQSIEKFLDPSILVNKDNVPIDAKQYYFPSELMPKTKDTSYIEESEGESILYMQSEVIEGSVDDFVLEWYSEHLFAMKEPLLFNRKLNNKEVYRFTWLRTFHNPIMVRIEMDSNEDTYTLSWKKLSGKGGYEPGHITTNKSIRISSKEWKHFISLMDKAKFWEMRLGHSSFGTDGSEWIMEGATPTSYRVVAQWSPHGGNFYEACVYLLSLTNLGLSEKDIY